MANSLTARWSRRLEQAWLLENEIRTLVQDSPKNIMTDHATAETTAMYFSNAIGELRNAISVHEAEQDSLDQCTEQELSALSTVPLRYCQVCGVATIDVRHHARYGNSDLCPRCQQEASGELSNVHMPALPAGNRG